MKANEAQQTNEPMRLNKYLAHAGIATRKAADELIEKGKVTVNGKRAELGMKVLSTDVVEVVGKKQNQQKRYYYAFNKPRGVITHSPASHEKDVVGVLPKELQKLGLFPVGRLDKDSSGLLILTNDGRITERLLSPESEHEKEYSVRVKMPLRPSFKKHMEAGIDIEGYMTKPAKVRITGEKSFSITLIEGKKHQIRRMVVAMHNEVVELKRTRVMNIRLGTLASGATREIVGNELYEFIAALGLSV